MISPTLYPGDAVYIVSWSESFNGMRGVVVGADAPHGRVFVRIEGDERPTLFFATEVKPIEVSA